MARVGSHSCGADGAGALGLAPRSPRPWSARTPPSPAWSSRCSAGATCCSRACPGVAKTLLVRTLAAALDARHQARAVHPRPDAGRRDRLAGLRRAHARSSPSARARSSPTSCSPTRSTAPRRRPRRRCWRRWRSARSRSTACRARCPTRSSSCATQNPIEYEGTYPLPEAQLDRFLLKLTVPLPARDDEIEVLARHAAGFDPRDLAAAGVTPGRRPPPTWPPAARRSAAVTVAPEVLGYVVDVCRATRQSPSLSARRLPARRHRAARDRAGLGLAVRPRLRHARRRQGPGPADAAPPRPAAARGRAGGRDRRRRARRRPRLRPRPALSGLSWH